MHYLVLFFLFSVLWKLWYFQFKNSIQKTEKCHLLFVFLFVCFVAPVKITVSDEQTSSARHVLQWEELGGSTVHGRAQGCLCAQPQHAAAWDPAQVHQLPCSCRRTGMGLDAKTSFALSQALILPWDKCSSAASRAPVHSPLHSLCCIWVSVSSCLSFGPPAWGSWGYGDAITLIISCCFSQRTPSGKWSVKAQWLWFKWVSIKINAVCWCNW